MAPSVASYWASLGGFAVPLFLLALLIVQRGRRGLTMPVWFDLALGLWFLLNTVALQPSGFPLGLVAVALLLVAARRRRSRGAGVATLSAA